MKRILLSGMLCMAWLGSNSALGADVQGGAAHEVQSPRASAPAAVEAMETLAATQPGAEIQQEIAELKHQLNVQRLTDQAALWRSQGRTEEALRAEAELQFLQQQAERQQPAPKQQASLEEKLAEPGIPVKAPTQVSTKVPSTVGGTEQ